MMLVQKHSEIGYRILKSTIAFSDVADIVLSHHEHVDGNGYPRGLKKAEIPFEARMLTLCDSYDAMISERPFRKSFSKEEAIEVLRSESGKQFDALLVEIFIDKVIK
jgi:HD-GYP domain-containing protein (c-di-GMP phosphodiesterase class II)